MKNLHASVLAVCCIIFSGTTSNLAATFVGPPVNSIIYLPKISTPQSVDELVKIGFELYKQKKYDEALVNFNKAAELSPKDFRPHALIGYVYFAQFKLKSASEEFAKAISLKPDVKEIYLMKARVDNLRGAKEEAIATCRKILEIYPSLAEAYVMIGDALKYNEKQLDEAIAAYRSAIKINPNLPIAYESLAEILVTAKDEKGAEEAYRQAIAKDPKYMIGRFALGRLLVKQGRLKEARTLWEERASDEDKTFPNFITVLERAEKLKQAETAFSQNPDDPEILVQMGLAVMDGDSWVVDGRQERAIVYFRKALAIKPDFAKAQYAICKAYVQIADTSKDKKKNVDEELTKLRQMNPKLADGMEDYRKNYSGGIKVSTVNINQ